MSAEAENSATTFDESAITTLYNSLLDAWNARDAAAFAVCAGKRRSSTTYSCDR